MKMCDSKFCRICLMNNVRMLELSGSEVQEVYERLNNKKFQEEVLNYACYSCYSQLWKCKRLVTKFQKSKELLKQMLMINNELNLNSITLQDRYTHGLVHSLTVTNLESLQIPEYIKIIKTENQDESDNKEMIKDEPYDDSTLPNEISDRDEKYNFEQDEANFIKIEKQEYVYGYETNTEANENMLSQIVCDRKSKPESVENCFICNDCGKSCDRKALLVSHIRGHQSVTSKPNNGKYKENDNLKEDFNIDTGEKQFECQYCNYRCAHSGSLKVHIRTHTGEKPFKCQYCSYKCTVSCSLKRHIRIHTGERPFLCQYCSCTFTSNFVLNKHIFRTHKVEKPFICQFCSFAFTTNSTLKKHIRTHTGAKPFKCQYCSYTCTNNFTLKIHIRTHTGEKPFKCQYCSYACIANGSMKKHIRSHTGEKPYKCQYCSYTCTDNSSLRNHITTHTGEKPFKCQYCSYTCIKNSNLKIHIRTHTGEKPFKCQFCSFKCTASSTLKKHITTHTGEKPFKRQYCSYACA